MFGLNTRVGVLPLLRLPGPWEGEEFKGGSGGALPAVAIVENTTEMGNLTKGTTLLR